mgnify:CR=1 FL=1
MHGQREGESVEVYPPPQNRSYMDVQLLKKIIWEVTGNDLGLCSFDMMVIIGLLEDKYKKSVDIKCFSNDLTVEGLLNSIH